MSEPQPKRVHVWDLPTRIFHWLLVALIFCAWVSFEFSDKVGDTSLLWHRLNGHAILILVCWRLIWGLVGSPTARFANFLAWPWTAARYGLDLARGRDRHYLGHNPLGSYMILALLGLVTTQAVLGLFSTEHNDVAWGPLSARIGDALSKTLTKYHVWLFEGVLLFVIAAHVLANVFYRFIKKDRLIEAMVTGTKPAGDYVDGHLAGDDHPASGTLLRAFICLVAAAAIVLGTIVAVGGKLLS